MTERTPRRARSARGAFVALALLGLLAAAPSASAQQPEGWGYALAHELMSPFCPGRTLAACTSPQAAELRQWILLQEASGASREEVVTSLTAQFGEVISPSPKAEGWGLAAWLLPAGALVLGAGVVVIVLRRMTGGAAARPSVAPVPVRAQATAGPSDAELERLVEEELRASDA